jgi:hypothetical protein
MNNRIFIFEMSLILDQFCHVYDLTAISLIDLKEFMISIWLHG